MKKVSKWRECGAQDPWLFSVPCSVECECMDFASLKTIVSSARLQHFHVRLCVFVPHTWASSYCATRLLQIMAIMKQAAISLFVLRTGQTIGIIPTPSRPWRGNIPSIFYIHDCRNAIIMLSTYPHGSIALVWETIDASYGLFLVEGFWHSSLATKDRNKTKVLLRRDGSIHDLSEPKREFHQ